MPRWKLNVNNTSCASGCGTSQTGPIAAKETWPGTVECPTMLSRPLIYCVQRTLKVCSTKLGGRFVFVVCIHV